MLCMIVLKIEIVSCVELRSIVMIVGELILVRFVGADSVTIFTDQVAAKAVSA